MEKLNPIFFSTISEESDIPLYYQLISIMKRSISAGMLKTGDALPPETEFCDRYNISRSTVRRAIGELKNEGLVSRRRGKGTFITEPKLNRKVEEVYSFSNEMRNMGLVPSSDILDFKVVTPGMDLIKNLNLKDENIKVYKIVRVRLANGEPLLLETTYIPWFLIKDLTKTMLQNESLYKIFKDKAGILPCEAEESYESVILDKDIANILKCKQNSSGFFLERKARTKTGEIYEFTQSIMRGDRTKFVIKLKNNEILFNRSIDT